MKHVKIYVHKKEGKYYTEEDFEIPDHMEEAYEIADYIESHFNSYRGCTFLCFSMSPLLKTDVPA